MGHNRETCPTRGELIEMYAWWERHRDDWNKGDLDQARYVCMEFSGMLARAFKHIERDDADLRAAFLHANSSPEEHGK